MNDKIEVSAEDMRLLHDQLSATVERAEAAMTTVLIFGGSDPGAQMLRAELNRGAGYFRQAAATIERLFRARNSAAVQAQIPHDQTV